MTPHYVSHGGELNWLLDDLVKRVPQVSRAVMLTQDGLAIGASAGLSREDAEHLAALASGFQSMARGAGQHFGGGLVRQTIIEMESAFLFVSAAGSRDARIRGAPRGRTAHPAPAGPTPLTGASPAAATRKRCTERNGS